MKNWRCIVTIALAVALTFCLSFTALAKSLPKERLVGSIGLLGTTADYSPQRYNMQRMIVASWKKLGLDAYNDPTKYEAMIKRAFRSKRKRQDAPTFPNRFQPGMNLGCGLLGTVVGGDLTGQ